jgi:hypothetical protein
MAGAMAGAPRRRISISMGYYNSEYEALTEAGAGAPSVGEAGAVEGGGGAVEGAVEGAGAGAYADAVETAVAVRGAAGEATQVCGCCCCACRCAWWMWGAAVVGAMGLGVGLVVGAAGLAGAALLGAAG